MRLCVNSRLIGFLFKWLLSQSFLSCLPSSFANLVRPDRQKVWPAFHHAAIFPQNPAFIISLNVSLSSMHYRLIADNDSLNAGFFVLLRAFLSTSEEK
ncbi:hypothetical protein ARC272_03725 [Pantoea ananatis]|nr:hypothetical protein ARC272_03725 [Pantoea ananatis]